MPRVRERFSLPVATIKDFKLLVQAVYARLDIRATGGLSAQSAYPQITASAQEKYPGRHDWRINYKILLDFRQNGKSIDCSLTVSDDENNWAEPYCKKELEKIKSTLMEMAKRKRLAPDVSTLHGRARWADEAGLRAKDYIVDELLQGRLLLAPWNRNEVLMVPVPQTQQHALVTGPTGSGKSSGIFIPNLVSQTDCSAIVTEAYPRNIRPELYTKTAGLRAARGQKIYYFSPGDMTSVRINPLDIIVRAKPLEHAILSDQLASQVIINTTPIESQRTDPIWDNSERALLSWLIAHVVARATDERIADPSLCNFGAIRQLAAWDEKKLVREITNSPSAFAAQEFSAFYSHSSENFRHGVFSGLLQRLNIWTNEEIATLMEVSDLDPETLRHELFTFYFASQARRPYFKPVAGLVFNWLLDLATETDFDHPIHLYLDEFTNFGFISGMDELLSLVARKSKIPIVLGFQDWNQLERVYQRTMSRIIVSQLGTRIFFRPRDLETATNISKYLGQTTIADPRLTDTGQLVDREVGQALLSPADVLSLDDEEIVIITPNVKQPIKCKRFTWQTFPLPAEVLPPHREPVTISETFRKLREKFRPGPGAEPPKPPRFGRSIEPSDRALMKELTKDKKPLPPRPEPDPEDEPETPIIQAALPVAAEGAQEIDEVAATAGGPEIIEQAVVTETTDSGEKEDQVDEFYVP